MPELFKVHKIDNTAVKSVKCVERRKNFTIISI